MYTYIYNLYDGLMGGVFFTYQYSSPTRWAAQAYDYRRTYLIEVAFVGFVLISEMPNKS